MSSKIREDIQNSNITENKALVIFKSLYSEKMKSEIEETD